MFKKGFFSRFVRKYYCSDDVFLGNKRAQKVDFVAESWKFKIKSKLEMMKEEKTSMTFERLRFLPLIKF